MSDELIDVSQILDPVIINLDDPIPHNDMNAIEKAKQTNFFGDAVVVDDVNHVNALNHVHVNQVNHVNGVVVNELTLKHNGSLPPPNQQPPPQQPPNQDNRTTTSLEEKKDDNASKSDPNLSPESIDKNHRKNRNNRNGNGNGTVQLRFDTKIDRTSTDPVVIRQLEIIRMTKPSTPLEIALYEEMLRKESQIDRLTGEVLKLKQFISKRKQVYKRKRKDEGAPTRALSAYNIFVQDRFSRLAKENEEALQSADSGATLKRVPPASLVASTGGQWKDLPLKEKAFYEERAKTDRKRYEEQMAKYQPPDKQSNRKRNKTGYNMFFSYHVNSLKSTDTGVPSERGSVARLVGNAWKELSNEEKQHFEREADKKNGMNSDGEEEEMVIEEEKRTMEYAPPGPPVMAMDPNMHRHVMPPQMGHAPVVHQPTHHDPRMYPPPPGPHGPYQPYPPPPPGYYDYPPHGYPHGPPPHPHPHGSPPQPQPGSIQRGNQERGPPHPHPSQNHPHAGHPPYPGPPPHHPHPHHYHPPPHYPPHMEQRQPH